jgi:predicted glycosyltransferase involved in capsule biosynthesis
MKHFTTLTYLLFHILIQGLYHGAKSANIWIYHMYHSKHTRQKSLQKYMKFWKPRLPRLNNMFDSYIKENYKVVEYHVKTPSLREHTLTRRPYGYKLYASSRMCL